MRNDVLILVAGILISIVMVLATIITEKAKDRGAYMECLRITEKLLKEKPDQVSTPYCRL